MPQFSDNKGRCWTVELSMGHGRRMKQLGYDFVGQPKEVLRKLTDPYELCEFVWLCIESQAAAQAVDQDDFFDSLSAESLDEAGNAACQAIVLFFPTKTRAPLERAIAAVKRAEAQALKRIEEELTDERMDAELAKVTDDLFADLEESLHRPR